MRSAAAVALMPLLIYAAYTKVVTRDVSQWARQLPKIVPSLGRSGPPSNNVFEAHPNDPHRQHIDRFSRFYRAHECDRRTDIRTATQTNHATASVAICRT